MELKDKADEIADVFFQRYESRHQTTGQPFPDVLRKFALSLHLKSAKSYRYLSSVFQVGTSLYLFIF